MHSALQSLPPAYCPASGLEKVQTPRVFTKETATISALTFTFGGWCVVRPSIPLSTTPFRRYTNWQPSGVGSPGVQKPRVTAQGSKKCKNLVFPQRKTATISDLTVIFGGWCVVRPRIPLSMTPFEGTPTGNRLASIPADYKASNGQRSVEKVQNPRVFKPSPPFRAKQSDDRDVGLRAVTSAHVTLPG